MITDTLIAVTVYLSIVHVLAFKGFLHLIWGD